MYFVHSFRAVPEPANADWVLATTDYGGEFVSALKRGEARPWTLPGGATAMYSAILRFVVC